MKKHRFIFIFLWGIYSVFIIILFGRHTDFPKCSKFITVCQCYKLCLRTVFQYEITLDKNTYNHRENLV